MADKFTHICFISVLVCRVCNYQIDSQLKTEKWYKKIFLTQIENKKFPLCCFLKIALFPYFNQLFCVIFFLKHTIFHFSKDMDNINQMLLLTPQKLKGLCLMKCHGKNFQNLPYFWNMKTILFIYLFNFVLLFFQIMIALIHADIGQGRAISFVKK